MRILLYIAIAFILWRIVRSLMRPRTPDVPTVGGRPPVERRIDPTQDAAIDYSKIRDAEYRELRRPSDGERDSERGSERPEPEN